MIGRWMGCREMQQRWQAEPNGDSSATMLNLRLVIRDAGGFTRFLLLRRSRFRCRGEMLLESGCENDVSAAKAKAVQRATKLAPTSVAGRSRR
jgi:hypothetical protein